jgi:Mycothiol maleylpyruvate isomerase N-terminal domain
LGGVEVGGATDKLDAPTPCDDWDVATLMNHMLDTQNYFLGVARGQKSSPPSSEPPVVMGEDPVADLTVPALRF